MWPPRAQRQAPQHRKYIAVTASLGLHALLLWLFLLTPPGHISGGYLGKGAAGEGDAEISLVSAVPHAKPVDVIKPQPPQEMQLQSLPHLADTAVADVKVPLHQPTVPAPQTVTSAAQTAQQEGQTGTGGNDLWHAIAPCWNRLADAQTRPVTLDVSFNAQGGLSAPPVIERAPGASQDPETLRSEAIALAALSQCGAYTMAGGQKDVKVNFPKP